MTTPHFTQKSPVFISAHQTAVLPTFDLSGPQTASAPSQTPAPSNKRCNHASCKTKLLLSDLACKCGLRFCGKHRYAEEHSCSFDYRKSAEANLSTNLVKCVASSLKEVI